MTIHLYLKSKNFRSFKNFTKVFFNICLKNKIIITKYQPLITNHSFISLLKSPHVNKTAQEQFEFKNSHRKIILNTVHLLKLLVIIKYLNSKLVSDIKIKVLLLTTKKTKDNLFVLRNNVKRNSILFTSFRNEINTYLTELDVIGENLFKQFE